MYPSHPGLHATVAAAARDLRGRIGGNLHALRLARRMKLEKLSRLSGLSVGIIDEIELGRGSADLHAMLRLCAVLDVPFETALAPGPAGHNPDKKHRYR